MPSKTPSRRGSARVAPARVAPARAAPARAAARRRPLTDGPRWYRARIRTRGPILALLLPTVIGVLSFAALKFSDASWSGAVGLLGIVAAAPLLLAVGAPFGDSSRYFLAIVASGVLWFGIGWLAAFRATRNPLATWNDFWRHYLWMAGGIAGGAVLALGMATIVLGGALI